MRRFFIPILLCVALTLGSCATLFYGTKQKVKFNSEPSGARVFVNGIDSYKTTPCEIKIPRKQALNSELRRQVTYEFRKDNFNSVVVNDYSNKKVLVTIFSWYPFILPGIIDMSTGANNHYVKSHNVKLSPIGQVVVKTDTVVKREIVYVEKETEKPKYVFERKSHVDKDIPRKAAENMRRFALIVGNEDYSSHQVGLSTEVNVHFARNDASAFKDYAVNILGVPERNITFLLDATTGQMRQAISKINALIKSTYGEADVIVYYAGHGLPDESTREPYLMPVDVSGRNATDGIKLNELYERLTEHPSKRVTVFIDACFSGGARSQGLMAARGVRVRPRENPIAGNLVVFAASSGEQASLPYADQHHGFFTYFLLKFLKEKGPEVTYSDIADYMKRQVEVESILVNEKEQTPQVITSPKVGNDWMKWNFR